MTDIKGRNVYHWIYAVIYLFAPDILRGSQAQFSSSLIYLSPVALFEESEKEQSADVELKNIRPFPKAQARSINAKTENRRFSAILTDSPIKNALAEEKKKTKKDEKKKTYRRKLDKSKITKVSLVLTSKEKKKIEKKDKEKYIYTKNRKNINEKEDLCVVCNGKYSKSKENWIKCLQCANWIHESCADLRCICYTCAKYFYYLY